MFGKKKVGKIVAVITKMRAQLEQVIRDNEKEIEVCDERILDADAKLASDVQKAEEALIAAKLKADTTHAAKYKAEVNKIAALDDEMVEAQSWIDSLPAPKSK